MEPPGLKLVAPWRVAEPRSARRHGPAAIGLLLMLAAALATLLGADRARKPVYHGEIADQALRRALERGVADPEVRSTLRSLRRHVAGHPLDTSARAAYASLLLGVTRRMADTRAAAFHASLAARMSPVTVPVVRSAARVLARSGDGDEAVELIRSMFGYDPDPAARLLVEIEPLLFEPQIVAAIAATPEAWLAWARQLQARGREEEALEWMGRSFARWPGHLPTLNHLAARAVRLNDRQTLERLLPDDRILPSELSSVPLMIYRGRLKGLRGDLEGARRDIEAALDLIGRGNQLRVLAGDAYQAIGDVEQARTQWSRMIFTLPSNETATRRAVLVRLARLEDRHGESARALRLWRSVLRLAPDDAAARHRVNELTGARE